MVNRQAVAQPHGIIIRSSALVKFLNDWSTYEPAGSPCSIVPQRWIGGVRIAALIDWWDIAVSER